MYTEKKNRHQNSCYKCWDGRKYTDESNISEKIISGLLCKELGDKIVHILPYTGSVYPVDVPTKRVVTKLWSRNIVINTGHLL